MTEQVLLRTILDLPDEDAPRLVYADWLEERGDPRGEFIRLQCELAKKTADDPRRIELEVREWQLLTAHEDEWVGPLRAWVEGWEFRRGFIEEVTVSAGNFLDHAEDMIQYTPLRGVRLLGSKDWVQALADFRQLAHLDHLDLSGNHLGSAGIQILAISPHLAALTSLNLRGNHIDTTGVQALAASPHLTRLTTLDLSENPISPMSIQLVALSPYLGRQAPLYLHYDPIGHDATDALQDRFGERLEFRAK